MDLRKVKKLIELVEESGINELEVANGDESIRISMGRPLLPAQASAPTVVTTPPQPPAAEAAPVAAANAINAPMAGTFYRAPSPEADPYVEVGTQVSAGDVVCIIESMKMMHEIRTAQAGKIRDISVANGTPIGTGDALFVLD